MSNKICVWILAFGLVGLVGCSDKFKIVPVSGQVTAADGKPLDKIFVEFYPSGEGPKSYGETNADGKFTLKTNDGKDGAMIGKHRVSLKDTAVLGDKFMGRAGEHVDMTEGRKPRIANKYTSIDTSELTFDVTEGGEGPKFQPAAK
jgi:hypothetical protein